LALGSIKFKCLHTPGHTPESSSYVILHDNKPAYVLTGDTLFLGEVGRPDLAVAVDLSRETLAGWLFDSLRNKIMKLPGDCVVLPGHGAGKFYINNIKITNRIFLWKEHIGWNFRYPRRLIKNQLCFIRFKERRIYFNLNYKH